MLSYPITVELNEAFQILSTSTKKEIKVILFKKETEIGHAYITTDHVDVITITSAHLDPQYINVIFDSKHTLGEVFVKFIIKIPCLIRKPEFVFALGIEEGLKPIFANYKFNEENNHKNEILVRKNVILPSTIPNTEKNITFDYSHENDIHQILGLLRKNAYWQANLTFERLNLLIENSICIVARKDEAIIGFARVLTNDYSFASVWDVVIDKAHQNKGLGTALMHKIFTLPQLHSIPQWILFTDTAKNFYSRFGFVTLSEHSETNLIQKLRLQPQQSEYMADLLPLLPNKFPAFINSTQAEALFFGKFRKRKNTRDFLTEIELNNKKYQA